MTTPQIRPWPENAILSTENIVGSGIPPTELATIVGKAATPIVTTVQDSEYTKTFNKTLKELTKEFKRLRLQEPLSPPPQTYFKIALPQENLDFRIRRALHSQDFPWIAASLLPASPTLDGIVSHLKKELLENRQLLFEILDPTTDGMMCSVSTMIRLKLFLSSHCCTFFVDDASITPKTWEWAISDWSKSFTKNSPYSQRISELLICFKTFSCLKKNKDSSHKYRISAKARTAQAHPFTSYLLMTTLSAILRGIPILESFSYSAMGNILTKNEFLRQLVLCYGIKLKQCITRESTGALFLKKSAAFKGILELIEKEVATQLKITKPPQQPLEQFLEQVQSTESEGYLRVLQFVSSLKWVYFFLIEKTLPEQTTWNVFELFSSSPAQERLFLESNQEFLKEIQAAVRTVENLCFQHAFIIQPEKRLAYSIRFLKKGDLGLWYWSVYSSYKKYFSVQSPLKRFEAVLECDATAACGKLIEKIAPSKTICSTEEEYLEAAVRFTKTAALYTLTESIASELHIDLSFDDWVHIGKKGPSDLVSFYSPHEQRVQAVYTDLRTRFAFSNVQYVRILLELLRKDHSLAQSSRMSIEDHIHFLDEFSNICPLPLDICYACLIFHDLDSTKNQLLTALANAKLQPTFNCKESVFKFEVPQYSTSFSTEVNSEYKRVIAQFGLLSVCNSNSSRSDTPAILISNLPFPEDRSQNCYVSAALSHWKHLPGYTYSWRENKNGYYNLCLSITKNLETLETVTESLELRISKQQLQQLSTQYGDVTEQERRLQYYQGDTGAAVAIDIGSKREYETELKEFAENLTKHINKTFRKSFDHFTGISITGMPTSDTPIKIASLGCIYRVKKDSREIYSLLPQGILSKIQDQAHCFSMDSLDRVLAQKDKIVNQEHSFTQPLWFLDNSTPCEKLATCTTKKTADALFVSVSIPEYKIEYALSYPLSKKGCHGITWTSDELCQLIGWQTLMAKSRVYEMMHYLSFS
jgi:hypothetical protein